MFIITKENESNFLELIKENNYLLVGFDAGYSTTEITNFLIEIAFGYENETEMKPSVYLENISFASQDDFKETLLNFINDKTLPEIFVNGVALHEINKTEPNSKKRKNPEPEIQPNSAPAPASLLPYNQQSHSQPPDESQRKNYYSSQYRTGIFLRQNSLNENEHTYLSKPVQARNSQIESDEEEIERPLKLKKPPQNKPQADNVSKNSMFDLPGFSLNDIEKSNGFTMDFSDLDKFQGFTLPGDEKSASALLVQEDQSNVVDPNELLAAGITEEQLAQWEKEDQIENDLLDAQRQTNNLNTASPSQPKPTM